MQTWTDSLFYIAFLGQIFVISWYFPEKLLKRMRYVMDTYPPEQYPKLYPSSVERYRSSQRVYKAINRVIVFVGIAILLSIIFVIDHATFADDGYISEFWPMLYGIIQFVPALGLEISEYGQMKLMRKAVVSSTRKADLRPRRLFEHVSPQLLVLAVAAYFIAVVFDLYVHDFDVSLGHDTVVRALVLGGTNIMLASLGAWMLYGKKLNPHIAYEDRSRHISASLTSFLYCSIAMSAFFLVTAADDVFDMDYLDATLLSVYFTAIVVLSLGHLLRSQPLEEMNFDVYKENGAAAT